MKMAIRYGTQASNLIIGTELDDMLYGYAFGQKALDVGNDTINGGKGRDFIDGAGGNDLLSGGEDDDTVLGGTGSDALYGGGGNDVLDGGRNQDVLIGYAPPPGASRARATGIAVIG